MVNRLVCQECNWRGLEEAVLIGCRPFQFGPVRGCPHCRSIEPFYLTCDEPDCWEPATIGTPAVSGYRRTCHGHRPK